MHAHEYCLVPLKTKEHIQTSDVHVKSNIFSNSITSTRLKSCLNSRLGTSFEILTVTLFSFYSLKLYPSFCSLQTFVFSDMFLYLLQIKK